MVEKGELDCYKLIDGKEIIVKSYSAGDAFGELALLYSMPRQASIISQTDCVLWSLDRETFKSVVRDSAIEKK